MDAWSAPWSVKTGRNGAFSVVNADDYPVCRIVHWTPSADEMAARLIAAAPNLHDFAADDQWRVIMGALDKWSREGGSVLVALGIIGQGLLVLDDKRRAALRAARGEQGDG